MKKEIGEKSGMFSLSPITKGSSVWFRGGEVPPLDLAKSQFLILGIRWRLDGEEILDYKKLLKEIKN